MKKAFALIFTLLLAITVFVSCSEDAPAAAPVVPSDPVPPATDTPPVDDGTVLLSTKDYRFIYDSNNYAYTAALSPLVERIATETGVSLKMYGMLALEKEPEILIGNLISRADSVNAYKIHSDYDTESLSAYSISFAGQKLVVSTTDDCAFRAAVERLGEFVSDGRFAVPRDINEFVIFDSYYYEKYGRVVEKKTSELDAIALLESITIGENSLTGFLPTRSEYVAYTNCIEGYPTVFAKSAIGGSKVEIIQPNEENGGIATIGVTANDGVSTMTYKVQFIMEEIFDTAVEIVNKDGKKGVITFVLDDGYISTAKYVEELMERYPETTATFAMITKKVATLALSEDGTEYLRDENGNFIITQTDAQKTAAEYWQGLVKRYPQLEITSHSHTHAYAGEDDSEVYTATDINGNKYIFPKGSVSAEVYGSQQIVKALFGDASPGFIIPGISGAASGFTINSWWDYIKSGTYLGARGTSGSTNVANMVMSPSSVIDEKLLWRGRAFMIRYFNMTLNPSGSFYPDTVGTEEILSRGISHATSFIDAAIENGGWACFCLHEITNDGSGGVHPIYKTQADALFAYANSLSLSGDAWIATYGDALTYYVEWANADVSATAHGDEYIDVYLTCAEKNDHFNVPLTVKVAVPADWENVTVTASDGTSYKVEVSRAENGSAYVFANVLPETVVRLSQEN